MPEFGLKAFIGSGFCIDAWGAGPFLILVDGEVHRFEDSDRFGPLMLGANDMPADKDWREGHPFWAAHRAWVRGGRRLEADGQTCVWTPPKPTVCRHLGGRHWIIVEQGDEDGQWINQAGKPLGEQAKRRATKEKPRV